MENQEKDVEFYKGIYDFEIERKDRLDQNASTLLAAFTGIVVALVHIVEVSTSNIINIFDKIACASALASGFCAAFGLINLTIAYHSRVYKYIDYSNEIRRYQEDIAAARRGGDTGVEDFSQFLIDEFVERAAYNARQNDMKSEEYYSTKKWLYWASFPLIISGGSFIISSLVRAEWIG